MLVDAFVLRVAAMSEESGGQLLIFPKYNIPTTKLRGPNKTCKVGGTLDYLLVLLPEDGKSDAGECLSHATMPVTTSNPSGARRSPRLP